MTVDDVFEGRVAEVVYRSARVARLPDPGEPPPKIEQGARELALRDGLAIDDDAMDFLWSLVARAVEPKVGNAMQAAWGNGARIGMSLAQHLTMCQLPPYRRHALLALLDPAHPLRATGMIVPTEPVVHLGMPWVVADRVWRYLRGDDALDPEVARVGGEISPPWDCALSDEQRGVVDHLAEWLASGERLTVLIDGPRGTGRRTGLALATNRPTVMIDASLVGISELARALLALRREAVLRNAVPVLANLDEAWLAEVVRQPAALAFAEQLDQFPGPVGITTGRAGLELPTRCRATLRETWPVPDIATRRVLWQRALGDAVATDQLDTLAMRYALGAGGIAASVAAARHRSHGNNGSPPSFAEISAGVQDNINPRWTATRIWRSIICSSA